MQPTMRTDATKANETNKRKERNNCKDWNVTPIVTTTDNSQSVMYNMSEK